MHVSSLPGKFGIGGTGEEAFRWIDFLDETGAKYWQILPLNPTGYGNSPYQGLSAFAGNPFFIDPEKLRELGLLDGKELQSVPRFPAKTVNYPKMTSWKMGILRKAFQRFQEQKDRKLKSAYTRFKKKNIAWLQDFSLYMALRESNGLKSWIEWPELLRFHDVDAINRFYRENEDAVEYHSFLQFIFSMQWAEVKKYANEKGIEIIGDIPIFTGYECADVWANPHLFQLDKNRAPRAVAGVPPDFFSETGQLWGNPLYQWNIHEKDNFTWWISRVRETLKAVDIIRLDHFRGFAGYFRIPADAKTAETGKWAKGPGKKFFNAMRNDLGNLPFIAEDLGVITRDVIALRDHYQFPGMRLLQFAFQGKADNEYLPHNYPENCVAYTGTHDSDTTVSWYKNLSANERCFCRAYLGGHTSDIAYEMIRTIWRTNAAIAIAPMQDFLRLKGWARMNLPASIKGNWKWRMRPNALSNKLVSEIRDLNITFDRASNKKE